MLTASTAGSTLDLGATWFWDGQDRAAAQDADR
jgi:hypothetical protein